MTVDVDKTSSAPAAAIMSGVEVLARLLVLRAQLDRQAGLRTATMVSGYPGSPLAGLDLTLEGMGEALHQHRIVHRAGLNEELAAAAVWGSQMGAVLPYDGLDGVAGAWYGKGPGLDRSGDAIKHGNAMGAGPSGGVVMFCGDDPASKSSTLACDSQYTFEDACVPVLYPADQQDLLDLGVHAFRLSRYAGCWTGMKIVTAVADGIGTVDLSPERHSPDDPTDVVVDGRPWRHEPLAKIGPHAVPDQEILVVSRRLEAAKAYVRHNGLDRVVGSGSGLGRPGLGIVCAGKTSVDVTQALTDLGVDDVPVLKLAMTYPLVPQTVLEFAGSVEQVLVVEEKRPFVETQLRSILHEAGSSTPVLGKRDRSGKPLVSAVGELDAGAVAAVLTRVRPELTPRRPAAPLARTLLPLVATASRAPGYCSGCPHNRSTVAPEGALVGGGVGCHGIMYFEARQRDLTSLPATPMGAEGVPWIGLAPFVAEPHLIQNIGDGTLSHSGTLAVRASVAAGSNVTFKILYNTAVAMTGGQDVTGLLDVPSMTRALAAEGVAKVVVCAEEPHRYGRRAKWAPGVRVLHRDELDEVQQELRGVTGVSVIIYDQRCAAESRRLRKRGLLPTPPRRVVINEGVCEGCADCSVKSNCLSVLPLQTEFGEKRQIHDPSCNRDYTCLDGNCPSFVTITPSRRGRRRVSPETTARPVLPTGALPAPPTPAIDRRHSTYFTGVGGTGVITANRIIAAAAEAAGLAVGGVDQTGLSQKAGAVVSHLQLARGRADLGSAAVGEGSADLYISGDILQAAGPAQLARIRPDHTVAVIDPRLTPTAAMLQRDTAAPDPTAMQAAISERVGSGRLAFVDAKRVAEAVFNDHLLANIVLLGAAFQLGGLPFTAADVEQAMQRQGRSASSNREAFGWGRWMVHDPAAVEAALSAVGGARTITDPSPAAVAVAVGLVGRRALPPELRELLIRRSAQAIDYQDARLAGRYLDLVGRAAARDDATRGWALTRAVIESWYKVLTYKDEYEVARLHLAADHDRTARRLGIDGSYTVKYHLHPRFLHRLGVHRKIALGRPYELMFRVLRRLKWLRGTPFDVLGRDRDRRLERAVVVEYRQLVEEILAPSSDLPYDALVRLAGSVTAVKGYAEIKEANAAAWRAEVARLRGGSGAHA